MKGEIEAATRRVDLHPTSKILDVLNLSKKLEAANSTAPRKPIGKILALLTQVGELGDSQLMIQV